MEQKHREFANETLRTIFTRRSVRKFEDRQLAQEELSLILEAGRRAPSGGNNQTTHFTVIQSPEIRKALRRLTEQELAKMEATPATYKSLRGAILASQAGTYRFDYEAPTLVVLSNRQSYGNAMADCVCALENMHLAAHSLGIGACYINALHWLDDNPALREFFAALGLLEEETICASLALGYPAPSMRNLPPQQVTGNPVTFIR